MEELIYLPTNIAESEVLSLGAKKVLNALLNRQLNSDAKETGIITIGWSKLRKEAGVGKDLVKPLAFILKNYNLISIEKGVWTAGKKDESTKFIINFEQLRKPLEKNTFEDMFSAFLKPTKSLETPISTKNKNTNKNKIEYNTIQQNKNITELEHNTEKLKHNTTISEKKQIKQEENKNSMIILELNQYSTKEDIEIAELKVKRKPDKYKIVYSKTPEVEFFNLGETKELENGMVGRDFKFDKEVEDFNKKSKILEEREKLKEGIKQWFKASVSQQTEEENDGLPF